MSHTSKGPIFIVGVARSGTTLLRYMLCSHPNIYVPPESNFIPRFFRKRPTQPISREKGVRIIEQVARYGTFWRDWRAAPLDPQGFIDALPELTPSALVDALYSSYARQYGAVRWGDKSTIYVGWIDLLDEMFPTSKFVHIIRDPRDVTVSSLDAYRGSRFFYMDAYYAARMWSRRMGAGVASAKRLPPARYHEIRYEDLIQDPESRLRTMCDFLEEDFHPAMLAPQVEAQKHYHKFGIHERAGGEITSTRTGRWRRDLSPADQRLVQRLVHNWLPQFGYEVEDLGRPGVSERIRAAYLEAKFEVVNLARWALQRIDVFNPARLLLSLPRQRPRSGGSIEVTSAATFEEPRSAQAPGGLPGTAAEDPETS
jgi:Sulfotransferase family